MNVPDLPWVAFCGHIPKPTLLAIEGNHADWERVWNGLRRKIGWKLADDEVNVAQVCRCLADALRKPDKIWPQLPPWELDWDRGVLVCAWHVNMRKSMVLAEKTS